jgi:hypothetical protein
VKGLENGDTVSVALQTSADTTSPVGAYPVTATVVPATATRVYGAPNPTFAVSAVTGLLNGDTVTATPNPPPVTASVGTDPVPAVLSGPAAGNYMVVGGSASLTIVPAPLTVTWAPATRPLYVALRGVRMISRFGGKAVRPLAQHLLSLSRRLATAPLLSEQCRTGNNWHPDPQQIALEYVDT